MSLKIKRKEEIYEDCCGESTEVLTWNTKKYFQNEGIRKLI